MAGVPPADEPGSPLIGRDAEVALLGHLLEEVRGGTGRVVIVEGEAGIGKTRLVADLVARALQRGVTVRSAAADELAQDSPFSSVGAALGLDVRDVGPDGAPAPLPDVTPDRGYRFVELIVSTVERLAAAGPTLVVLEDVHWADPSTLRAVRDLGRAVGRIPMLLVVTLRRFPHGPELDRVLVDLRARGAACVDLEPLGRTDVAALATALAGVPPDARLAGYLGAAGGNPLHVVELVAARAQGSDDEPSASPTLRAAILRHLGFLPADAYRMLSVAAVLGQRFPVAHLAAVLRRSPVDLLDGLDAAVRAGVLDGAATELAFRHELLRAALYQELSPAVRTGLHREAARALGALGAPLGIVAEHCFLGATAGDVDARDWLARAARDAAPRAPTTAVKLFERAIELTDPVDPAGDALVAELVPLLIQTGRAADAQRRSRDLMARGPGPGTEAALRRALGEVLWTRGWLEPAVAELDAAGAMADSPDTDRRGSKALAAHLRLFLGQRAEAAAASTALLDELPAQGSGDDFSRCTALQTLALAADAEGWIARAAELSDAAVHVATRSSEARVGHLHPHLYRGLVLLDADRPDEAEEVLQAGRQRAEERGTTVWLPLYHCVLAIRRVSIGQLDDAVAECEVGLGLAEEVGTRLHASFLNGLTAWVALQRGDLPEAQARLEAAASDFVAATTPAYQAAVVANGPAFAGARWPLEWGLWLQGLLHEIAGDAAQALASVDDAWTVAAPLRYFLGYRYFAPDLVRLARTAGDVRLATLVTGQVEEGARRAGTDSARGAALRCRGLLDDDPDVLAEAVERYRASPYVTELALTLDDAGLAMARSGDASAAIAVLEEAAGLHAWAGASARLARTDAALRALGVRHRRSSGSRRATTGWDSLTPTESAVVRLAAEGLTNRQVGERLFVSRRTVDTHLAHVFAKLGISSRAQLAAEAARRGVGDDRKIGHLADVPATDPP